MGKRITKQLEQALDRLLKSVNDPESEDSDVVQDAMHVLMKSGRTPDVWRNDLDRSD